jgi:hypothetical protein
VFVRFILVDCEYALNLSGKNVNYIRNIHEEVMKKPKAKISNQIFTEIQAEAMV